VSSSYYHSSAARVKWRQYIPPSHFNNWWVTDAFIRPSDEMTECWMAHYKLIKEEIAHDSLGALKVIHVLFFSQNGLVLNHPVPVGTTVNGQYYCSLLQDKERPALQSKQLKGLQCDVILLRNKANLGQCRCWEMLAHSPYSTDLAPCDYCLFACEGTSSGKTILIRRRYQHCCHRLFTLSEQRWTQICKLIIYHVDGKSVCEQLW
jgi:hypothetical protein